MADGIQDPISTNSYPKFETPEVAEKINFACIMARGGSNDSVGQKALDSLFKKRREDALQKKDEDPSYLEFVDKEEKKVRQLLDTERADSDDELISEATSGKWHRFEMPDLGLDALRAKISASLDPGGFSTLGNEQELGPEAQSKKDVSLLRDYLSTSKGDLDSQLKTVEGNKKRIEALLRLIEKAEAQQGIASYTPPALNEDISDDVDITNGLGDNPASGIEPVALESTQLHIFRENTVNAIAILREHVKEEEDSLTENLTEVAVCEKRIAAYIHLIGE